MTFPPYKPEPEQQLTGELMRLTDEWEKLGIDPDDFVKCSRCHLYIRDLVEGTEPPLDLSELCNCQDQS